jgi:hypothetical protein
LAAAAGGLLAASLAVSQVFAGNNCLPLGRDGIFEACGVIRAP